MARVYTHLALNDRYIEIETPNGICVSQHICCNGIDEKDLPAFIKKWEKRLKKEPDRTIYFEDLDDIKKWDERTVSGYSRSVKDFCEAVKAAMEIGHEYRFSPNTDGRYGTGTDPRCATPYTVDGKPAATPF